MHLAIDAGDFSCGVKHRGRVVVDTRGAPLEDGGNNHQPFGLGNFPQRARGGAGDRLGEIEIRGIFPLAKIPAAEKLRQANQVRSGARRPRNVLLGALGVFARVSRHRHLNQTDRKGPPELRAAPPRFHAGNVTRFPPFLQQVWASL